MNPIICQWALCAIGILMSKFLIKENGESQDSKGQDSSEKELEKWKRDNVLVRGLLSNTDKQIDQQAEAERVRQRDWELREFKAMQECPKCSDINCHRIMARDPWSVLRGCNKCGHEWKQK